jgi:DNA-binding CsgD family transcriptional regulator
MASKIGRILPRRFPLNEAAFDTITPESAYWAGFLMADGCVYCHGTYPIISLTLSVTDVNHLRKFERFLGSEGRIRILRSKPNTEYKSKDAARMEVGSRRLATALGMLGITSRKTFTATPCESLCYNRHFWRGVIDGDGWLSSSKCSNNAEGAFPWIPSIGLIGSRQTVEKFSSFISTLFALTPNAIVQTRNVFQVTHSGEKAVIISKVLYGDCQTYLDRKYDRYLLWAEWRPKSSRSFIRSPKVQREKKPRPWISLRQMEMWTHLKGSGTVTEIAERIGISNGTAWVHIRFLYRKLGVHFRSDLPEVPTDPGKFTPSDLRRFAPQDAARLSAQSMSPSKP